MTEHTDTSTFDRDVDPSRRAARLLVEEAGKAPRTVLVVPGMAIRVGRAESLELSVDDQRVSREHAVFRYDGRAASLQDLESSNGTWIGEQRVQGLVSIAPGTMFRVGSTSVTVLLPELMARAPRVLTVSEARPAAPVIAVDPASVALFALAERLGPSELPVLIQGETGSGKEVLARTIHRKSPRAAAPFISVNCATLPDSLAEGELFGLERGADGAHTVGVFEAVDGGTLMLDAVSELSATSQARLLRVLQERALMRVGATRPVAINVRLVTSTHCDLAKEVSAGRFREDLYFRLNGVTVDVPPLRSRPKDIPAFVQQCLDEHGGRVTLGTGVAAVLSAHRWPGNVRELRNAVHGALALVQDGVLKVEHLPPAVRGEPAGGDSQVSALRERVDETERKVIINALESTGWNQSQAARVLGISRRALIYKMERYGLKPLPNGQRNA